MQTEAYVDIVSEGLHMSTLKHNSTIQFACQKLRTNTPPTHHFYLSPKYACGVRPISGDRSESQLVQKFLYLSRFIEKYVLTNSNLG